MRVPASHPASSYAREAVVVVAGMQLAAEPVAGWLNSDSACGCQSTGKPSRGNTREGGGGGEEGARSLRVRVERWESGGGGEEVAGSLRVHVERWESGGGGEEVAGSLRVHVERWESGRGGEEVAGSLRVHVE